MKYFPLDIKQPTVYHLLESTPVFITVLLEPKIYSTRGEHTNHYTIDAVVPRE